MNAPLVQTPGGYDYTAFLSQPHDSAAVQLEPVNADRTQTAIIGQHMRHSDNTGGLGQEDTSRSTIRPDYPAASTFNQPGVNPEQTEILHRDVKLPSDLSQKVMYPQQTPPRTSSLPFPGSRSSVDAKVKSADDLDKQVYGSTTHSTNNTVNEASPSVQNDLEEAGQDPKPDFVLVFSLPVLNASSREWQEAEKEYTRLIEILRGAKFHTAARPGGKDRNERLILIKAVQSLVRGQAQAEKLSNWLNTNIKGSTSREDPHRPRDFRRNPLDTAERVRLVGGILERALYSPQSDKPFPRLLSYFPPHDPEFNTHWLKSWSNVNISIPEEQLVEIKDQFGESVALYFEFLRYYFLALGIPAFVGISTWAGGYHFSKLYSFLLVLWSNLFLEGWKLRERQLSVRWGTFGTSKHGKVRLGFKPEETMTSEVTGEEIPYSPWWRRELRISATVPAIFAAAAGLAAIITLIFCGEVLINEVYTGPGKQFFSLVPTAFFASVIPQVVSLWYKTAKELTIWENHPTEVSHERSLTYKMFALNAVVSYGALLLTAYVYLPFGAVIVPYLASIVHGSITASLDAPHKFVVSSQRLTNTLFALMTTTQGIGAFTEVALPFIQRKIAESRNSGSGLTSTTIKTSSIIPKHSKDQNWLERIRSEVELPEYSLFTDYAEMVVQFGHVVLFSTAWPLAPVAAFINNFFELRGDAFKLCVNSRRPIPQRTDTIGPWIEAMSWTIYFGVLTNASLVYLLRPYTEFVALARTKAISTELGGHNRTMIGGRTSNPHFITTRIQDAKGELPGIKGMLMGALFCALASEHAFLLLRHLTEHLVEMLLWRGSGEELALRHAEWQLKKDYIDNEGVQAFEKEIDRLQDRQGAEMEDGNGETEIWNEKDKGIREELQRKKR